MVLIPILEKGPPFGLVGPNRLLPLEEKKKRGRGREKERGREREGGRGRCGGGGAEERKRKRERERGGGATTAGEGVAAAKVVVGVEWKTGGGVGGRGILGRRRIRGNDIKGKK